VIDRFNDERLRCKEQAPCAAYLSLKNRELQLHAIVRLEIRLAQHQNNALACCQFIHVGTNGIAVPDAFFVPLQFDTTLLASLL
jgi:hypothetical protein